MFAYSHLTHLVLSCLYCVQVVDWNDNFRMFFIAKLANPHYSPEVVGKTMIVNCGVTMDELANQLLIHSHLAHLMLSVECTGG